MYDLFLKGRKKKILQPIYPFLFVIITKKTFFSVWPKAHNIKTMQ